MQTILKSWIIYLNFYLIFHTISGNDCKCVHYEDCRWSSEVMKLISQMPRKDPRRIEKINFVRNQTCDTKQKLIYCCGPNQESRTAQLCKSLADQFKRRCFWFFDILVFFHRQKKWINKSSKNFCPFAIAIKPVQSI